MLMRDRAKWVGLLFGITFTSFLVTFAASYFCGFMTRGFALVTENPAADVWVMDPAVSSVEQTVNLPDSALSKVRSVEGVLYAAPLALGMTEARFPNGQFQPVEVIGVDDATLSGIPATVHGVPPMIRAPDSVIVDPGGTSGKLDTPVLASDHRQRRNPQMRALTEGDELLLNDHRIRVVGRSETVPRFPPRPLLYTTFTNAARFLPPERHRLTFILVTGVPGVSLKELAARIQGRTGLRARAAGDFKSDTVHWFLTNSEDVGDIAAMLTLAMSVGFGVAGVMLYMFTRENLWQYGVLKAMGGTSRMVLNMVFIQAAACALLGSGFGLGICGILGASVAAAGYPFRMMWFTPLIGGLIVLLVSVLAAAISARPVMKLEPAMVFAGR